jgi:DNA-binding SARP family transcriptional activator
MEHSGIAGAGTYVVVNDSDARRNEGLAVTTTLGGNSETIDGNLVVNSGGPGRVRLSLLRDFELRCNDQVIDVPPTSQRLIVFLAIQGQRQARRNFVSGSLWMDSTDARANASLRSAIWRSPAVDGEPLIGASNTHVWLQPDLEVDLNKASLRAQHLLSLPSLDGAGVDVTAELGAFSDDILFGWYDEWVLAERERFRQLRLHVLEQLGELLLRAHQYSEALQFGLVAAASEPLRDSAHRLLVRAHLCEGNVAEALRQYHAYADSLARELQVRPSQSMEDLISDALAGSGKPSWNRKRVSSMSYGSRTGS